MPYVPPATAGVAATSNPSILEPAAAVTVTDGYGLCVPGEYVLDSTIELIVGSTGGLTEVHIT